MVPVLLGLVAVEGIALCSPEVAEAFLGVGVS
jgi:hypothetical protein